MPNLKNKLNGYADLLPYYDRIPKAVLAAIAVSYTTCGGDWPDRAAPLIAKEWRTLALNGIVPQPLPHDLEPLADQAEQAEEDANDWRKTQPQ